MEDQLTPKEFGKYLARDGGCLHCGETEALSPNHRANRGMGGSKARDVPSNIIVLCSAMNGAIESNHKAAAQAKRYGWKLDSWQDPMATSVYDTQTQEWYLLDNQFGRKVIV
jgi:hypothetical protein